MKKKDMLTGRGQGEWGHWVLIRVVGSILRQVDSSQRAFSQKAQTDVCFRRHCGYCVGTGWAPLVRNPLYNPGTMCRGVDRISS